MFGLKDAYFYFVALRISFIKFFKKIYFTSNRYNKSLLTKVPSQVYFNPNPFLLTIISPFKAHFFKVSEINPNNFWLEKKSKKLWENHNFLWLNLINRKTDGKNIQKIIYLWMLKYFKFKREIWDNSLISTRIISWILNSDIIINNGTFEFKKNFFQNIITQSNHIKKNLKYENNPLTKIQMFTALILSGLAFKEYEQNFNEAIGELEKFAKNYYDKDGFPISRNPNDLIFLTKYLLLLSETIKDSQRYLPEFLEDIIEKNLECIKIIKTPDEKIPFFNGGSENDLSQFEKYLENISSKRKNKHTVGGLFHAKLKNQLFFLDVESPPSKNFSRNYQSGPLSFEYFLDGKKIVTNCGFGNNISLKSELISRLTACQSTLTINDTTINEFERSKLVNKVFGNSIKSTFKTSNFNVRDDKEYIGCSITHNGYEKNFNCIHKREVYLDKKNNKLKGIDHIIKKSDGIPIRYVFRFHINPELNVIKTMSGNSALIQLSKNKSLIFTITNEKLEIEKSIFLGGKKILDNSCITIAGNLVNKNKTFNWEIRKKL